MHRNKLISFLVRLRPVLIADMVFPYSETICIFYGFGLGVVGFLPGGACSGVVYVVFYGGMSSVGSSGESWVGVLWWVGG